MSHTLALIAVMATVTIALRFLPFLLFEKHTPGVVLYLGELLPCAVMAMLVVYCFKGVQLTATPHGLPELSKTFRVALTATLPVMAGYLVLGGVAAYRMLLHMFV